MHTKFHLQPEFADSVIFPQHFIESVKKFESYTSKYGLLVVTFYVTSEEGLIDKLKSIVIKAGVPIRIEYGVKGQRGSLKHIRVVYFVVDNTYVLDRRLPYDLMKKISRMNEP